MDELEKQLEVQSAIIEAQKSLVDQAKNRQMKKERKKEVKRAEEKFQMLEGKLYDLRNSGQRRTYSESRFDSPGDFRDSTVTLDVGKRNCGHMIMYLLYNTKELARGDNIHVTELGGCYDFPVHV